MRLIRKSRARNSLIRSSLFQSSLSPEALSGAVSEKPRPCFGLPRPMPEALFPRLLSVSRAQKKGAVRKKRRPFLI